MKITIELDTNDLSPEQLTAVGMLIPSPFDRKPADESKEAPKTMNRADVRLKEGDNVVWNDGSFPGVHKVTLSPFPGASQFHAVLYMDERGISNLGFYRRIISVNGIEIKD